MGAEYDLVIRGGTVIDGTGAEGFVADVAITGDRIAAIGDVTGRGREEIDAAGKLVTPGFVDIHTHYDGQTLWSERLTPSSQHGVTTAVIGNCGVGFAPCREVDRETLVSVMEGVEDIPEIVMTKGLPWNWETFPQFLDVIDSRKRDIDVAAYLPHSPLRIYAMGERGAGRADASEEDLDRLRDLTSEALDAGAIGFATSRFHLHRTGQGENIPSFDAASRELSVILGVMRDKGKGIFQLALDAGGDAHPRELEMLADLATTTKCPVTFSMVQMNDQPEMWKEGLTMMEKVNSLPGTNITAQIFPRPVGMMMGLETSVHPFSLCTSYESLRALPLAERVERMRDPELRAKILAEAPSDPTNPVFGMSRNFGKIFPLRTAGDYEPSTSDSIEARAKAAGVTPEEVAYDLLLENGGHQLLFHAIANFAHGTFDTLQEMIRHKYTVMGLGDGGAHYGFVSDASFPTYVLSYWARDRKGERLTVPAAVKALTKEPAAVVGLKDRGTLAVGYKADVNVIDFNRLTLHVPKVVRDLPGGGSRLTQEADGYVATIVSGKAIAREGQPTGQLPGRLIRDGGKHA